MTDASYSCHSLYLDMELLFRCVLTLVSIYCCQMNAECNDDLSLKKLLKAKPKGVKKRGNPISAAAESDMEKLCRAKTRVENLKQKLVKLQTGKARKSSKIRPLDESVVYVPIAELREKI